jgi:hypothetical protein
MICARRFGSIAKKHGRLNPLDDCHGFASIALKSLLA